MKIHFFIEDTHLPPKDFQMHQQPLDHSYWKRETSLTKLKNYKSVMILVVWLLSSPIMHNWNIERWSWGRVCLSTRHIWRKTFSAPRHHANKLSNLLNGVITNVGGVPARRCVSANMAKDHCITSTLGFNTNVNINVEITVVNQSL
jgi:hypothetical protein